MNNRMEIQLSSPAFKEGEMIPRRYTCDGENISPQLSWSGVPMEAKSLALIVNDPDAPRGDWAHWLVYNLEPGLTELPEAVVDRGIQSSMGLQGMNDFRRLGYGGPCPPRGTSHRYIFTLYALDATLKLRAGASKPEVERAMKGHILAQGQFMAQYAR